MKTAVKALIQGSLKRFGYRLQSLYDPVIDQDLAFASIYTKCKPFTMTTRERMYALYKAVKYVVEKNIPGDFVECGVWKGGSAMVMAETLLSLGVKNRTIYLYDTFEGMPPQTKEDKAFGVADSSNFQKSDASFLEVSANMAQTFYPKSKLVFVPGKVEDTIPKVAPKKIAILRLDTDWYASTRHELIYMYPKLSKGGVLIVDDYGAWEGAKKAVDEYFLMFPTLLQRIDRDSVLSIRV